MHEEEFIVKVIGAWHQAAADCLQLKTKLSQLEAERDQSSARLQNCPLPQPNDPLLHQLRQLQTDILASQSRNEELTKRLVAYENEGQHLQLEKESILQENTLLLSAADHERKAMATKLQEMELNLRAAHQEIEGLKNSVNARITEHQQHQLEKDTLLQEKAQLLKEAETHIGHVANLEQINSIQLKEIDRLKQLMVLYEADHKQLLKAQEHLQNNMSRAISKQPEPHNMSISLVPSEMYTLPTGRRMDFPPVVPNLANQGICFTRKFLKSMLGGNHQSLIVRIKDSMTALAMKRRISCFLCPNLEQNPWAPSTPGHHGYMFVGPGIEETTFTTPEVCNLFLGTRQHKGATLGCRYLGLYSALRVDSLTVEEWQTLSHEVKAAYSKTTKDKTNSSQSIAQVLADYDAGQRRVPCVQLKCVGYDEELFLSLLERITDGPSESTPSVSPAKRPHEDNGNGNCPPPGSSRSRKS